MMKLDFIDPHIVYNDPRKLKSLKEETRENIMMFFEMHRKKKTIVFPYNFL
jgi:hypothetical protein